MEPFVPPNPNDFELPSLGPGSLPASFYRFIERLRANPATSATLNQFFARPFQVFIDALVAAIDAHPFFPDNPAAATRHKATLIEAVSAFRLQLLWVYAHYHALARHAHQEIVVPPEGSPRPEFLTDLLAQLRRSISKLAADARAASSSFVLTTEPMLNALDGLVVGLGHALTGLHHNSRLFKLHQEASPTTVARTALRYYVRDWTAYSRGVLVVTQRVEVAAERGAVQQLTLSVPVLEGDYEAMRRMRRYLAEQGLMMVPGARIRRVVEDNLERERQEAEEHAGGGGRGRRERRGRR